MYLKLSTEEDNLIERRKERMGDNETQRDRQLGYRWREAMGDRGRDRGKEAKRALREEGNGGQRGGIGERG